MQRTDKEYLQICKSMIETQLGWPPSSEWKQRDFLQLINLLEDKTGTLISLSTIKRIWKPDFEGIPQTATLEALVMFLGYRNWLDFKTHTQADQLQHPPVTAKNNAITKLKRPTIITMVSIAAILVLVAILRLPADHHQVQYAPHKVQFSCSNAVSKGVPNTVIFDFDISSVTADSFFIQQSWDHHNKARVNRQDQTLTSTYLYPGYHKAKLIANDSVIRETTVQIETNGWLSLIRNGYNDPFPIYFSDHNPSNTTLRQSADLINKHPKNIQPNTITSYFNIGNYSGLHSSNFVLETKLKCDSFINIACPIMNLVIQGEGEMYYIPLIAKGCSGNIGVKLGETMITGKYYDLSGFGTHVYHWQKLKLVVKNHIAVVSLNDQIIWQAPFKKDIGAIQGLNFNFTGTGQIEYVTLTGGNE